MFYIFLFQSNDSVYETASQQSIAFDVHELLHGAEIGSSLDPVKVIEKTLKKLMRICFVFY